MCPEGSGAGQGCRGTGWGTSPREQLPGLQVEDGAGEGEQLEPGPAAARVGVSGGRPPCSRLCLLPALARCT